MPDLILASQSPRRQQLLAGLGLTFAVDAADVDETPLPGEPPDAMVCRLCRAKAQAIATRHLGQVVLAADTIVALDGVLLGKPSGPAEAAAMLAALRGRTHQVYTAVCVAVGAGLKPALTTRLSRSDVTMRRYSDVEIAAYVATGDPLDKAGAYAIQHPVFSPVAAWDGCYSGIMGLPLGLAGTLLAENGVVTRRDVAAACREQSGERCCIATA